MQKKNPAPTPMKEMIEASNKVVAVEMVRNSHQILDKESTGLDDRQM